MILKIIDKVINCLFNIWDCNEYKESVKELNYEEKWTVLNKSQKEWIKSKGYSRYNIFSESKFQQQQHLSLIYYL